MYLVSQARYNCGIAPMSFLDASLSEVRFADKAVFPLATLISRCSAIGKRIARGNFPFLSSFSFTEWAGNHAQLKACCRVPLHSPQAIVKFSRMDVPPRNSGHKCSTVAFWSGDACFRRTVGLPHQQQYFGSVL